MKHVIARVWPRHRRAVTADAARAVVFLAHPAGSCAHSGLADTRDMVHSNKRNLIINDAMQLHENNENHK